MNPRQDSLTGSLSAYAWLSLNWDAKFMDALWVLRDRMMRTRNPSRVYNPAVETPASAATVWKRDADL